jgi:GR25 family glycosyltransferase involved in LPS biosynthesis
VYVVNMDGADARLAAFQRTFQASDLKAKNFVRFPAVNGSALDAARLVSPRAYADIVKGGPASGACLPCDA